MFLKLPLWANTIEKIRFFNWLQSEKTNFRGDHKFVARKAMVRKCSCAHGGDMGITAFLAEHITAFIDTTGYVSVYLLMVSESMVFPVPSEAVMPFAGFLIESGRFNFPMVILVSTFGSITGSLASYCIGLKGGEPFIRKFGRFFLLNQDDLDATRRFFARFGEIAVLICRFIPVIRHLISIPAGLGRMNLVKFCVYTVIGACLWNSFLAWIGYLLRQRWTMVMKYSEIIDIVVIAVLLLLAVYFVVSHVKRHKKRKK
jgi:membrane protein DedA with SNARE-associated domain